MKPHFGTDRRAFLQTCAAGLYLSNLQASCPVAAALVGSQASRPVVRLETDPQRPVIRTLSWDTEGGDRVRTSLLRPNGGIGLRILAEHFFIDGEDLPTTVEAGSGRTSYLIEISKRSGLRWDVSSAPDSFT